MTALEQIKQLTRQLYPTGRAFKMPKNGWLESLSNALALSEAQAYRDAVAIHNSILPDNNNFTEDDCTDWERRLGMIQGSGTLEERKLAIRRKMQHPGDIKARQHYLYVEGQLQAAGFDVYVFENRFDDGMGGYVTQNPINIFGGAYFEEVQHGDDLQHGDEQHGGQWTDIVVNHIDINRDRIFNVGSNLRSTFFIGGNPLGTFAAVPAERRNEFRQLILRLKPVQTVAYLFIVYV